MSPPAVVVDLTQVVGHRSFGQTSASQPSPFICRPPTVRTFAAMGKLIRLFSLTLLLGALVAAVLVPGGTASGDDDSIELVPLGVYEGGEEGASEIVAFSPKKDYAYVTNGAANAIDIIDFSDPDEPELVTQVDLSPYGDGVQSVTAARKRVAAAVKNADDTQPGNVVVMDLHGNIEGVYEVGVLPDATAFTRNGRYVVVANEAEPVCADDVLVADPAGTVSIIDLKRGTVATADFTKWDGKEDELRAEGVRIFFPGSSASQDLEPEYVTISRNGKQAFITLQENNAVAVVDIKGGYVSHLLPLGYKDHSAPGNGLDPSNRDDAELIQNWDVLGMYMPDAIATFKKRGKNYLVTANEGDARDYDCYSEEIRVGDFAPGEGIAQGLGPAYAATDIDDENLGRLKTTTAFPTTLDGDDKVEQVYSYGARSFTIWDEYGNIVFDSGDDFGQLLLGTPYFNADDFETDGRSDDKGAEPEALALGKVDGRRYAFIGLERSGGIAVYDITKPASSFFVTYVNTQTSATDGDISPEGIVFISEDKSPTGEAMLLVSFEVSGTTRAFEIVEADD